MDKIAQFMFLSISRCRSCSCYVFWIACKMSVRFAPSCVFVVIVIALLFSVAGAGVCIWSVIFLIMSNTAAGVYDAANSCLSFPVSVTA